MSGERQGGGLVALDVLYRVVQWPFLQSLCVVSVHEVFFLLLFTSHYYRRLRVCSKVYICGYQLTRIMWGSIKIELDLERGYWTI